MTVSSYLDYYQDGKKIKFLEFPETEIGNESTINLKIQNPNHWPLMVIESSIDDDDITLSKLPDVIEELGSVTIDATLKPSPGRGPVKAELKIRVMF